MSTPRIIAILGILLLLITAGCVATPPGNGNGNGNGNNPPPVIEGKGWFAYKPVQASTNPWQVTNIHFIKAPTQDEQVTAWLSSIHVSYDAFAFIPHDEIVCQALNCPRGDYLVIHPSNEASRKILVDEGFFAFEEPFVFTHQNTQTEMVNIVLVNASRETIYFGGCNEFIPEKMNPEGNIPLPPKVCIWEGYPTLLLAGKTQTFEWEPPAIGTYRITLGYGTGCKENQPMSQAECSTEKILYSNPFDVKNVSNVNGVVMRYSLKQCLSNPWQIPADENTPYDSTHDQETFTAWVQAQNIHAESVTFIPANEGQVVCLACNCPTGTAYEIVIDPSERTLAESAGFVFVHENVDLSNVPNYAAATWYLYQPYQCYANPWNTVSDPVHSVEKDMLKMKAWLNEKGVNVAYMTFIQGYSLSQECQKKSTSYYGVGVTEAASIAILEEMNFVPAGNTQLETFTQTSNTTPINLLYKTRFCAQVPWGSPDLSIGNEAAVSERVHEWLAQHGITTFETPTIHTTPASYSGSCDTDSGLGVYVSVPAWAESHIGPFGFLKPTTTFNPEKTQVYPVVQEVTIEPTPETISPVDENESVDANAS